MTGRHRITVIYKSGATIDLTCEDFSVRQAGGTITQLAWDDPEPRPLHIGVDDVAAVWDHGPIPELAHIPDSEAGA